MALNAELAADTVPSLVASSVLGEQFGPYTTIRVLGEGGMGIVYLAEQQQPIRRLVALKVIKLGLLNAREVVKRFESERAALALMDHPNIARVFDVGTSDDARPWFAMEYVPGISITAYCDQKRLNNRERMALFIPVCNAIQHAHQKGVIHRDIKPSNVLVSVQDDQAIPKVIDFGVAKATSQALAERAFFTEYGQLIGTPEYMSPEQVGGEEVDTSTDIYSLGALLYELLVGVLPFDPKALRAAGYDEIRRMIREDEAPRPTTRLSGLGRNRTTELATQRDTNSDAHEKGLRGDLDWITMKALDKERARRYASASELAADVQRHLEDQAVMASPPSRLYSMQKFVRRNKVAVLAGAVAAAALVTGFGVAVWQGGVAARERNVAVEQRTRAEASGAEAVARGRETEIEKKRAEDNAANAHAQEQLAGQQRALAESRLGDVSALANSMIFEIGDGLRDISGTTASRELLVQRGVEYLNRMSAQDAGGGMQGQLGAAYLKVGELQFDRGRSNLNDMVGARESFARSIRMLEPQVKARPQDPDLRHQLTQGYLRGALLEDTDKAQQAGLSRALRSAEQLVSDQPASQQAQTDLADVLEAKEDYPRAVEIRQRVVAADPKGADARWRLYRTQSVWGDYLFEKDSGLASKTLEQALTGLEALAREQPANVQYQRDRAMAMSSLAWELQEQNRVPDAQDRGRQAVALMAPLAAADPRNAGFQIDLSDVNSRLGQILIYAGRHGGRAADGLDYLQKALAVQEKEAAQHPENPAFQMGAAGIHRLMAFSGSGDAKDVQGHYLAAVSLYRRLVRDHPDRREYARSLVTTLVDLAAGSRATAMESYVEALKEAEKLCSGAEVSDEDWGARALAHGGLSSGASALGRSPEAISEARLSIADYQRVVARSPGSKPTQMALSAAWSSLSALYQGRRDWQPAVNASLQALPWLETEYAAAPGEIEAAQALWNVLFRLKDQYTSLGEYDHGIDVARRMVDIGEKLVVAQPLDLIRINVLVQSWTGIAETYRLAGRRDESIASSRRAAAVLDSLPLEKLDLGSAVTWAGYYDLVIRNLDNWEERDGLSLLARRVVAALAALEPTYRAEPNSQFRYRLLRAYEAAAIVSLNSAQLREALEIEQELLQTLSADGRFGRYDLTSCYAQIGSLQMQLGQSAEATASWNQGAAVTAPASIEDGMALIQEILGNREEALRWMKRDIARGAQAAPNPQNPGPALLQLRRDRANAVRLQWQISGEQGDYRSLLGKDATPAQIRAELAYGWMERAKRLTAIYYPIPARIEAARNAVALSRQIGDTRPPAQADRAEELNELGLELLEQARFSQGAEKSSELREASQLAAEAHGILQDLDRADTLPERSRAELIASGNLIATVNAMLAGMPVAALGGK